MGWFLYKSANGGILTNQPNNLQFAASKRAAPWPRRHSLAYDRAASPHAKAFKSADANSIKSAMNALSLGVKAAARVSQLHNCNAASL